MSTKTITPYLLPVFPSPESSKTTATTRGPVVSAHLKSCVFSLSLKRLTDFLLAILGVLAIAPLMLLIALAVYMDSPGPVIYKSLRIGKGKKPFYMYKFRTMILNADLLRDDLRKQNHLQSELFKLKNDKRVTGVGRFLRQYSLDELPQLFNVIKGDMSLVGPRPYVPDESGLFQGIYEVRFDVTPGITGPWQVGGRSDLSFEGLCKLELEYITHWTLWRDASLLLRTVPSVFLKIGAY